MPYDDEQMLFERMAAFKNLAECLATDVLKNMRVKYSDMYFKAKALGRESIPFLNELTTKVQIIDKLLKERK